MGAGHAVSTSSLLAVVRARSWVVRVVGSLAAELVFGLFHHGAVVGFWVGAWDAAGVAQPTVVLLVGGLLATGVFVLVSTAEA